MDLLANATPQPRIPSNSLTNATPETAARGVFSRIGNAIAQRFQVAGEEFRHSLKAQAALRALRTQAAAVTVRAELVGYLIASNRAVPLYAGSNLFKLSPQGKLERSKKAETSYEEVKVDYELKFTGGRLLFDNHLQASPKQGIETNESLTLGHETFVVKLLPTAFHREVRVTLPGGTN